MQHDSIHHQIQLTAIRLWWNHAVILILSTEQEFDDIVDAVAKDSMLMFEDMDSAVKSFFRYEEYLTDWAFRKTPILSFIGLIWYNVCNYLTWAMFHKLSVVILRDDYWH